METVMEFTRDTLPFILTYILGWAYVNFSKDGDPDNLSNRTKINISIVCGVFLGIALMFYESKDMALTARNFKDWVKYLLMGFMIGNAAIGLNQSTKRKPTVESAQKEVIRVIKKEREEAIEDRKPEVRVSSNVPKHIELPAKPFPGDPAK